MSVRRQLMGILFMVILVISVSGCEAPAETVREVEVIVTQIVEGEAVEVTKIVQEEVEVVVTATPEPTPTTPTGPVSGGTLRVGQTTEFLHLNPHHLASQWFTIRAQMYDTLIRYDHELEAHPRLATSWELSDDGLELTIELREGVLFHNGRELVADDIIQNLEFAQNEETCMHMCQAAAKIEEAEAIDDYTVVFRYSEFDSGWKDFIEDWYIIAPEVFGELDSNAIGTGPFEFVEYIPDDHALLVKNEDYWGDEGPYVDEVYIRFFGGDQEAIVAALEAGEVDIVQTAPDKDRARLRREGFTVWDGQPGGLIGVFYACPTNIEKPIRQALFYAIDWQALQEGNHYNEGRLCCRTSYPETSWVYDPELDAQYPYDPERAREILTEAGYELPVEVRYQATTAERIQAGLILRDSMKEAGIELSVEPIESSVWLDIYYKGDYHTALSAIANSNKDDPSRLMMNSQYRCQNRTVIRDDWPVHPETGEHYCDLLAQAQATVDRDEAFDLYYKLQEIMIEEAWALGYRDDPWGHVTAPNVQGYDYRVDNGMLLENVWLMPGQ